jgi:hypothetical protein
MELLKKLESVISERGFVNLKLSYSDNEWKSVYVTMHCDYSIDLEAPTLEELFDVIITEVDIFSDVEDKDWGVKSKSLKQLEITWKGIQEHCGVTVTLMNIVKEELDYDTPFVALWKLDNPEADEIEYYIEQGYSLKDVFNGIENSLRDWMA